MANQINTTLVKHNYTYNLDSGDFLYFQMDNIISIAMIEIQFTEDSSAIVYDCINTFDEVRDAYDNAVQSDLDALNWIAWDLGEIDQDSGDKRLIGNCPSAFKVHNTGSGEIKVTFKGNRS